MTPFPSRLRRLDAALADLPLEEPMLLSELDGFLTGVLLCPVPIDPAEWMTVVWGHEDEGVPPFDDPLDVRWFADAVLARQREIGRDLARGKPRPIFDQDERNGDVLWEAWVEGLDAAMALRPDAWTAMAADGRSAAALDDVAQLIAVARGESTLDSIEQDALYDVAPGQIVAAVTALSAARPDATPSESTTAMPVAKVGRNDPCPCDSGRKSKRCCG